MQSCWASASSEVGVPAIAAALDARLAALGVAALALWLRAPFLLVVVLGAASAGVVRWLARWAPRRRRPWWRSGSPRSRSSCASRELGR